MPDPKELRGVWWRFWADSFNFRANRDHPYLYIVTSFLAPCHEDWWYVQPISLNDNDPP